MIPRVFSVACAMFFLFVSTQAYTSQPKKCVDSEGKVFIHNIDYVQMKAQETDALSQLTAVLPHL